MCSSLAERGLTFLDLFTSSRVPPCCNRTTSLRMEASRKQRCNVVEQTPSRLRVAAHFVCSIYQSKADNQIYERNKGSHRLRVNNGSQRKRDIRFHFIIYKGTKHKVQKRAARTENVFPSKHPKGLPPPPKKKNPSCL